MILQTKGRKQKAMLSYEEILTQNSIQFLMYLGAEFSVDDYPSVLDPEDPEALDIANRLVLEIPPKMAMLYDLSSWAKVLQRSYKRAGADKKAEYEDMTDKLNALANKISAYKSLWDGISRAGTFRENLRRELMMEEGIMYNRTASNYK
jgi:hypothetical protein